VTMYLGTRPTPSSEKKKVGPSPFLLISLIWKNCDASLTSEWRLLYVSHFMCFHYKWQFAGTQPTRVTGIACRVWWTITWVCSFLYTWCLHAIVRVLTLRLLLTSSTRSSCCQKNLSVCPQFH
jgi:hypothetical protein